MAIPVLQRKGFREPNRAGTDIVMGSAWLAHLLGLPMAVASRSQAPG